MNWFEDIVWKMRATTRPNLYGAVDRYFLSYWEQQIVIRIVRNTNFKEFMSVFLVTETII